MSELDNLLALAKHNNDYSRVIRYIRNNKFKPDLLDFNTNEPLGIIHYVVEHQLLEVLTELMKLTHIRFHYSTTQYRKTPLIRAIELGWVEGIQLLLQCRDVHHYENVAHEFALNLARQATDEDMLSHRTQIAELIHTALQESEERAKMFSATLNTAQAGSRQFSSFPPLNLFAPTSPHPRRRSATTAIVRTRLPALIEEIEQQQVHQPVRPTEFLTAAARGNLVVVEQYLIRLRPHDTVALNVKQANTGNTALMLAAMGGHRSIVDALIDAKIDLNAVNQAGQSAAVLAQLHEHAEIAALLIQLMTENSQTASTSTPQANTIENLGSFSLRISKINREHLVPNEYICPISREICDDPIEIHGDLYNRASLHDYFNAHPGAETLLNPLTRDTTKPIHKNDLSKRTSQAGLRAIRDFVAQQEALHLEEPATNSAKVGLGSGTYK